MNPNESRIKNDKIEEYPTDQNIFLILYLMCYDIVIFTFSSIQNLYD